MTDQRATGGNFQLPGRFHIRVVDLTGDWFPISIIAVGDAHHEDVGVCGGIPKHVVDHNEDNAGVSGFDMGRETLTDDWLDAGHQFGGWEYWNNTLPLKQCDGRFSSSDGWVYILEVGG